MDHAPARPARRSRSRVLALALTACMLMAGVLTGCTHAGMKDSDERAVRAALARWAAASTPAQACNVMSSGFRFFVGDGDYLKCAQNFATALGSVAPESVKVTSVKKDAGQVAVDAVVRDSKGRDIRLEPPGRRVYWFVWQRGAWRLNSIGERVGLGPPCHTYAGHPC